MKEFHICNHCGKVVFGSYVGVNGNYLCSECSSDRVILEKFLAQEFGGALKAVEKIRDLAMGGLVK